MITGDFPRMVRDIARDHGTQAGAGFRLGITCPGDQNAMITSVVAGLTR
jgi:hypothetical protein